MRTLKTFLVVSSLAAFTGAVVLQAADSPQQAALREALRKAMNESNGQQAPAEARQMPEAAPKAAPANATTQPVTAPAAMSADNADQLRQLLRKQEGEPQTAPPVMTQSSEEMAPAPATATPASNMTSQTETSTAPMSADNAEQLRQLLRKDMGGTPEVTAQQPAMSSTGTAMAPVPAANNPASEEQLRKALHQQMDMTPEPEPVVSAPAETPAMETPAETPKTAKAAAMAANYEFKPLAAPDLPISDEQQKKLESLLSLYKANVITPEQYHQQRAAILAGK